ncbi:MAG: hypothetical protein HY738_12360 [Bacteroidia bacterium]|nr:hypothetical protein [Bacteroidia bacterium]
MSIIFHYTILFSCFISILFLNNVFSQDTDTLSMVKYTPDYKFKDGIYLNFEQVKNNSPVSLTRIISDLKLDELDYTQIEIGGVLLKKENISFVDDLGVSQKVRVSSIWGYCRNGSLYINWNDEFNRIPVFGKVSHFVANVTVYHEPYGNPLYYYNNLYDSPMNYSEEMRQYILDFETGKVMEFSIEALEVILMRDSTLYDEFSMLKRKKKKQLLFVYLRKYNERNPLFLPDYKK